MGLDRRGFITFLLGGAAGSVFTPIPWKLMDDVSIWTQNWPWVPKNIDGPDEYVRTVSKLDPSNCGLKVRTVGGRPVRVIGDEDHPLSGGRITAIAASEVQLLYSPARMKRPLQKSGDGTHVSLTWDEAAAIIEEKLGSVKGSYDKFACVSGDENGSINEVLSGFTSEMSSSKFFIMPGELQTAAKAWNLMGGSGQIGYDIENSDFVLAVGADILESWGPVVRNRRAFADKRPHGEKPEAAYVYVGAYQTNTAAGSDQWIPIKPDTQAVFLLGLANELISQGVTNYNVADFDGFKALAATYTPAKVQEITGVEPAALKKLAQDLKAASKPLVIPGSEFAQGARGATMMAGIAVNFLLGRANQSGGIKALPAFAKVVGPAMETADIMENDLTAWLMKIAEGSAPAPEAIVFYEANPYYALPQNEMLTKALDKIPFKVAITQFMDETAKACDVVLPSAMGLERYDDVATPYGIGEALYCVAKPIVEPMFDVQPAGDFLLTLAARMGIDLGFASTEDLLETKAGAIGADFGALKNGEAFSNPGTETLYSATFNSAVLGKAAAAVKSEGIALAPVYKLNIGTATVATPPHNLKTIRDTELKGNAFFVKMNKKTAAGLGLNQGDAVRMSSGSGAVTARVDIFEGVMTNTVAAPLGFGHTAFDEYTRGKGDNISKVMTASIEPGTNLATWESTSVKFEK